MPLAIARVDELSPGRSKKFLFSAGGVEVEAFLLNVGGAFHAYVNRCRHVPMGLDWVENQFFTEDGDFLLCPTHGALYMPDSGECVSGPPCGKSLHAVEIVDRAGDLYALWPEEAPANPAF